MNKQTCKECIYQEQCKLICFHMGKEWNDDGLNCCDNPCPHFYDLNVLKSNLKFIK